MISNMNWHRCSILILMTAFLLSCKQEQDREITGLVQEAVLEGSWNLIQVSGNFNVPETTVPKDSVIWDFRPNDSLYISLHLEAYHPIYSFLSLFEEQLPYAINDQPLSSPSLSGVAADLCIGGDDYRIVSWTDRTIDLENLSSHWGFILSFTR